MGAPQPCWAFEDYLSVIPNRGWIRDYLAYAVQCTDAPPMYHIIAASALVANALAPEHECTVDGEPIPIHDFFLIVGESGSRKSAAIKRAIRVVYPCYIDSRLEHRIWYPEMCTPEGIVDALLDDPNRMMILTEWSELQAQGNAGYWQHAPQFWECLFDRTPVQRLKMKVNVKVERPSVTILGASTPSLIKQNTKVRDWEAGKMARYLIGYQPKPEEKEMVNAVEHPEMLLELRRRYAELFSATLVTSFQPSTAAKKYKDVWQYSEAWKAFVRSLPEHLKPSGLRAGDHAYRLAALYQASIDYPWNMVIEEETMAVAIQMVWWCLGNLRDEFGLLPLHEQQPIVRVRACILSAGTEGISRPELLRRVCMHTGELDRVLATLRDRNELQWSRGTRGLIYHHPAALG